jgi:hypothetical protein
MALMSVPDAGATVTFSGSSNGLSASASFSISGTTLTVLLTNTDTGPGGSDNVDDASWVPSHVLTGVFFDLGSTALTKVSATVPGGSAIVQTDQCDVACAGATDVGGEWGYIFYPGGAPSPVSGTNQAIAASGYIGGGETLFGGTNYDGPESPNGLGFGIVASGFTEGSGNGGVDNAPLIRDTVSFVLTIPEGLSENSIDTVYFTYGTSLGENTVPGHGGDPIPEPPPLALLGSGLAFAAAYGLRRRVSRRV